MQSQLGGILLLGGHLTMSSDVADYYEWWVLLASSR